MRTASKNTDCSACAGLGKQLVRKSGKILMVACKQCKGKGSMAKTVKVKRSASADKAERLAEKKAERMAAHKAEKKAARIAARKAEKVAVKTESKGPIVSVFTRSVDGSGEYKKTRMNEEQQLAKETIEERAAFFGCPGKVKDVRKGPVITLYEFAPAKTTRIRRLASLQEDLALALSVEAVMVRRIPGRDVIGIEISNEAGERQNVAFRASLQYVIAAKKAGMALPMNLGTDPFGEPIIDDLAAMPHLLIAGSTGSGKSVSLNCIISSLLTVCSPDELEFYMIDPKGVELTHYNGIPHMKEPMVTSPHYAKQMLETLIREMRRRLQTLTYKGVRDIKELNTMLVAEGQTPMPRIVLIVDELGDLMMQDRREFTRMFAEISQIARATGIHMIVATQRPSVDVLPGKVKVNFPARMAFKVTSSVDSRTIVHRKGAEGLLGCGDMLYLSPTRSTVIRVHAPWVPLEDVKMLAGKMREIEDKRQAALAAKREAAEKLREAARAAAPAIPTVVRMLPKDQKETMDIDIGWAHTSTNSKK
jgi:S-DNA-T family DNA segregation ATPase FtsK/SpoIIIE